MIDWLCQICPGANHPGPNVRGNTSGGGMSGSKTSRFKKSGGEMSWVRNVQVQKSLEAKRPGPK